MIDRRVSTACLVPRTTLSSNARVDAVRAEPRKNGGGRSGGSLGLRCLAAGRPLHPICPRSVQGKWELEGDNRRFRPRGAQGQSPSTDNGGPPEGWRGSVGIPGFVVGDKESLRLPLDHEEPVCSVRGLRPCSPSGEGTAQTPRFPPRTPLSGGSAPRRICFPAKHRSSRSARVTGYVPLPESTRH